jgi:outer membrane protein assembly factor BamB
MIRLLTLGLALFTIACSSDDEKPPLQGERISIMDLQKELRPSESASLKEITLPPATLNKEWPQAGGYSTHAMQNLSLGDAAQLERIWNVSIGRGSSKELPLNARPIIADGRVITLDTKSMVRAFHDQTGRQIWATSVAHEREKESVISGGIAQDAGFLYLTSGYNEVLAINPQDGSILWRTRISAPSRAAPTVKNGRLFITTLSNNVIALDAKDGKILWEYEGVGETTGLLGAASPTVDDNLVVAALSSGDLLGLRADTGAVLWEDNLSSALRFGRNMAGLSDIRGYPVIFGDAVIAVSYGGKIVVIDKKTGNRKWQQEISSAETPWVAGNTVYVLNSDYQLVALNIISGEILWIASVPKYKNPEKRKELVSWTGPVMAGDRLLVFGSNGAVIEYNPATGELLTQWVHRSAIYLPPVIANGALYILDENARLSAYR